MISLMAVARYDVLAMRQLGLNVPKKMAVRGGFVAVSIGQTLGFGLIVGAIARWRFYRGFGVGPKEAGLISGIVTIGFLNGFAIILSICVLIAPEGLVTLTRLPASAVQSMAALALVIAGGLMALALLKPTFTIGARQFNMPKLRVVRAQIVLAALDVIPAGIALWVLIPSDIAPSLLHVIPVYLAALGLGLVSNSPGGLGVLELTCLMALPVLPPEQLVAALIAYRGIYFGVPAVIAAAMLVAKEMQRRDRAIVEFAPAPVGNVDAILATGDRADAALAYLGDKYFIYSKCYRAFLMYGVSGNSLIALSDPTGPKELWGELVDSFQRVAETQMLTPSFYKTGAEFTDFLESRGQFSAQIASEAMVDLANYSTSGSSKRELRRKLKSASELEMITHAAGTAPRAIYARVSKAWAEAKGGERGFSMGYFKDDYIARFTSIEARLNGQSVGFLTIWTSGDGQEHGLDVMRLTDDAPDGTMHALVHAALERAKAQNACRFSLCAVPFMVCEEPRNWVEQSLTYFYEKKPHIHGSTGLYRFKNAFRPDWEPRYGVAPSVVSAAIAAWDANTLINDTKDAQTPPVDAQEDEFEFNVAAA